MYKRIKNLTNVKINEKIVFIVLTEKLEFI